MSLAVETSPVDVLGKSNNMLLIFKASFPARRGHASTSSEKTLLRSRKNRNRFFEEETNGREMEAIAVPSLRHPCEAGSQSFRLSYPANSIARYFTKIHCFVE